MHNKKLLIFGAALMVAGHVFAEGEYESENPATIPEIKYCEHGDIPGNQQMPTNGVEVLAAIVQAKMDKKYAYGWSHPYDWRLVWESASSSGVEVTPEVATNISNTATITRGYMYETVRNSAATVTPQSLDEVNPNDVGGVELRVVSGSANLDGNMVIPTAPGEVEIEGIAKNGTRRSVNLALYLSRVMTSNEVYYADNPDGPCYAARNRVNNYMLQALQQYRSNPTTNYYYTTWGEKAPIPHLAYAEDKFTGAFGSIFNPYQFQSTDSGGSASFWWSHAAVSKHVLASAAHYGDYNHNRHLNGMEYFNVKGGRSGKTGVKFVKWYYLDQWAKDHGFEGDDTNPGDIALMVVDGDIPDECLPYIASVDYLNSTYGCDLKNHETSGQVYARNEISCVTFNQPGQVSVRAVTGVSWGGHPLTGPAGTAGNLSNQIASQFRYGREDIWQYTALGCWHNVSVGDSGHPTFLYDPALTGTYNGETFIRPILLTTETSGIGGGSYPRCTKLLVAFCRWIAEQKGITFEEEMPYRLGDLENQSMNAKTIEANAVRAMGGTPAPHLLNLNN